MIVIPDIALDLALFFLELDARADPHHHCAAIRQRGSRCEQSSAVSLILAQDFAHALGILQAHFRDTITQAYLGEIGCSRDDAGLRGEPIRERLRPALYFIPQGNRRVHQLYLYSVGGPRKPGLERPVQNAVSKGVKKHDRQQTQRKSANDQLGLEPRTFAAALPLQVQLYYRADQPDQEDHGQYENEGRENPQPKGLSRVCGAELAEFERNLPHHQREQEGEHD